MRWCCRGPLLQVIVVMVAMGAIPGCSTSNPGGTATSSTAHPTAISGPAPSGTIGISPAGVTTSVEVPADSTEEEYFQACHAAKIWMDTQPGEKESLIEPYLAMVQTTASGTAGSWHIRWADLTPARQAAVIVAARAAAHAECG